MKFAHHYKVQKPPELVARQAHLASISTCQSERYDCARTRPMRVTRRKTRYTLSTEHPQHMCKKNAKKTLQTIPSQPPSNIVPFSHHQKNVSTWFFSVPTSLKNITQLKGFQGFNKKKIYKVVMKYSISLFILSSKPTCRLRVRKRVFFVKKLLL